MSKKFDDDDSSRQKTGLELTLVYFISVYIIGIAIASTKSSKKSKGAKKDKIDVDEVDGEVIGICAA